MQNKGYVLTYLLTYLLM